MNASHDRLVELSAELGFEVVTLEKVIRLGEVLEDIGRHPLLSTALQLKGGTALNLCFGSPVRLSVDLDFNYVAALDRAEMLRDRPVVEQAVERIARARGYSIQRSRDEHAGRKIYLGYPSVAGTPDRIEVDLNYLNRLPLTPAVKRTVWQPTAVGTVECVVAGTEELCSGKLCAALSRSLPRDLHDVIRLPAVAGDVWTTARFRALFVAIAGTLDHPLHTYGDEQLRRVTDENVRRQLHPVVHRADRPSAGQLIEGALQVFAPLLVLSDAEREYSERIQNGELRPELLFPDDPALADRLRMHPALLWKAKNAAEHASRRKPQ